MMIPQESLEENKKVNYWKFVSILFLSLFILETSFVLWSSYLYQESIEKDNQCYYDVCNLGIGSDNLYDSHYYDSPNYLCYCFDEYGEIKLEKRLK